MKSVMIVFLLFFVTVDVIYAKPHGSAAMEKGNKERKSVVIQRQHASSNMSGENAAILLQNDDEDDKGEDEKNLEEEEELKEQITGHCLRIPYKEYPCDHGHRVGCVKKGKWAGYCWRSCLGFFENVIGFLGMGWEYPRNKEWNYLRCSDPSLGKKADMECIEKGATTGHGGKLCYV